MDLGSTSRSAGKMAASSATSSSTRSEQLRFASYQKATDTGFSIDEALTRLKKLNSASSFSILSVEVDMSKDDVTGGPLKLSDHADGFGPRVVVNGTGEGKFFIDLDKEPESNRLRRANAWAKNKKYREMYNQRTDVQKKSMRPPAPLTPKPDKAEDFGEPVFTTQSQLNGESAWHGDYEGRRLIQHQAMMSRVLLGYAKENQADIPLEVQFGVRNSDDQILVSANKHSTRKSIEKFYTQGAGLKWMHEKLDAFKRNPSSDEDAELATDIYKMLAHSHLAKLRPDAQKNGGELTKDQLQAQGFTHSALSGKLTLIAPHTAKTKEPTVHAERSIDAVDKRSKSLGFVDGINGSRKRCAGCSSHLGFAHSSRNNLVSGPTFTGKDSGGLASESKMLAIRHKTAKAGGKIIQDAISVRQRSGSVRLNASPMRYSK